jgi:hypothetical protein
MIFESASDEQVVTDNRNHSFPVAVAIKYSPQIALWLQHLAYWTEHNLALNQNIHDGLCWSYATLESLGDQFPYLSKSQRETMVNNSIKEGLVIKGNYNQTKYDRTVWYALTPKAYAFFGHLLNEKYLKRLYLSISEKSEIDIGDFGNRFPGIRTPIPDTNPNTNTDNKHKRKIYTKRNDDSDEIQNPNYTQDTNHEVETEAKQKSDKFNNHEESIIKASEGPIGEINQTKSDYSYSQLNNQTARKNKKQSEINYILENNIFNLPEQMIDDWITFRNKKTKPVTKTVWNSVNKDLAQCEKNGNDPIKCFEESIAKGWVVPDPTYFNQQTTKRQTIAPKPIYDDNDTSWINQKLFEDMY